MLEQADQHNLQSSRYQKASQRQQQDRSCYLGEYPPFHTYHKPPFSQDRLGLDRPPQVPEISMPRRGSQDSCPDAPASP
uniref:Uncharacterized protein n=1 Tax=Arundo donax TaxID=35708 RepID=A0A0A9ECZ1_ARUDO